MLVNMHVSEHDMLFSDEPTLELQSLEFERTPIHYERFRSQSSQKSVYNLEVRADLA